jgi:hypothetical protein
MSDPRIPALPATWTEGPLTDDDWRRAAAAGRQVFPDGLVIEYAEFADGTGRRNVTLPPAPAP